MSNKLKIPPLSPQVFASVAVNIYKVIMYSVIPAMTGGLFTVAIFMLAGIYFEYDELKSMLVFESPLELRELMWLLMMLGGFTGVGVRIVFDPPRFLQAQSTVNPYGTAKWASGNSSMKKGE